MDWRQRRRTRVIAVTVVATALAAACTSTPNETTVAPATTVPTSVAPPATAPAQVQDAEPTPQPLPTIEVAPAPTVAPQTTAVPTALPTSLPDLAGEPWELFVPLRGEPVAVVGVAFDDILEVHVGPGENSPLIGTLDPLAVDIISAGEARQLRSSIWWRVTQGELDGWVGSRFVVRLGGTNDVTADVVEQFGAIPSAETMVELGNIVAATRVAGDPPPRLTQVSAPVIGDLGEIVFDRTGFRDDSVAGERLRIFGQPLESGEGFSLKTVEATVMCSRGVSDSGLCT